MKYHNRRNSPRYSSWHLTQAYFDDIADYSAPKNGIKSYDFFDTLQDWQSHDILPKPKKSRNPGYTFL